MNTTVVTLDARNGIVLPEAVCEVLGVVPGDSIRIVIDGERVCLLPEVVNWSDYIYGWGKAVWDEHGSGEKFLRGERTAWSK